MQDREELRAQTGDGDNVLDAGDGHSDEGDDEAEDAVDIKVGNTETDNASELGHDLGNGGVDGLELGDGGIDTGDLGELAALDLADDDL